jgi:hypothetical protein
MGIRTLVERIERVMIEGGYNREGYDDARTDVESLARNIVVLEPVLYDVTLSIRNDAEDAAINAIKHARSANLNASLNKQDQLADDILKRSEEVHDAYQAFIKAWKAAQKPDAAPKELRAVVPSYSDLRMSLLKLKETIAGKPQKKGRAR